MMNLAQKVVISIGIILLAVFVFVAPQTYTVTMQNPAYKAGVTGIFSNSPTISEVRYDTSRITLQVLTTSLVTAGIVFLLKTKEEKKDL